MSHNYCKNIIYKSKQLSLSLTMGQHCGNTLQLTVYNNDSTVKGEEWVQLEAKTTSDEKLAELKTCSWNYIAIAFTTVEDAAVQLFVNNKVIEFKPATVGKLTACSSGPLIIGGVSKQMQQGAQHGVATHSFTGLITKVMVFDNSQELLQGMKQLTYSISSHLSYPAHNDKPLRTTSSPIQSLKELKQWKESEDELINVSQVPLRSRVRVII